MPLALSPTALLLASVFLWLYRKGQHVHTQWPLGNKPLDAGNAAAGAP